MTGLTASSTAGADLCRHTPAQIIQRAHSRSIRTAATTLLSSHRRKQEPTPAAPHDLTSQAAAQYITGRGRGVSVHGRARWSGCPRSPRIGRYRWHRTRYACLPSRVTAAKDASPPLHCAPIVPARRVSSCSRVSIADWGFGAGRVQVTESHIKSLSHGSRTQRMNARHAELPSVLVGLDCARTRSRSRVLTGVRVIKVAGGHGGCQSHSRERSHLQQKTQLCIPDA